MNVKRAWCAFKLLTLGYIYWITETLEVNVHVVDAIQQKTIVL
jgi:hypothetical protein